MLNAKVRKRNGITFGKGGYFPPALFTLSLESSVTGRRPSATQEAGENKAASEKAVTEEVNMATDSIGSMSGG